MMGEVLKWKGSFIMKITASTKMSIFEPSIFGRLKEASINAQASGKEIIDLSIGSPDIPPAEIIRNVLAEKSTSEDVYGYTLGGTERFHKAVADYYKRRSNVELDPHTEVLKTMGSQEGLVHLPFAFCEAGDIVLTTNPAYVAYDVGIKMAGATPYEMPLRAKNDFLPDLASIPEDVAKKAKLLILNLPGNPVPAMPTTSFFEEVVAFARKYNIIVLHDAAYSEFYFKGDKPFSFLAIPGAKEVGIEINSLSKSFSLAGARIAYIVGNKDVIQIMKQLKSNLDYGTFEPIQEAAATALDHAEEITDSLRLEFKKRHEVIMNGLEELGWTVTPSNGGMFIWAKYPFAGDDTTFVLEAIKQAGVVMVPGSVFGTEGVGYVRIALVQEVELLEKAVGKLRQLRL